MGSLNWRHADDNEADRPPFFGSLDNDRVALLMRVEFRDGEWRFRDEVPAVNRRETRSETWYDLSSQPQMARWFRETVRVPTTQRSIARGSALVLALYPYSAAQVDVALFKRGSKKGSWDRPDASKLRFQHEADFLTWTESHEWDYWEKGNYLVAGVGRPTPLQDLRSHQRRPRATDPYRLVFGLCEKNFEALARELADSDRSRELLEKINQDKLKFWFQPASGKMAKIPKLSDEIKDQGKHLWELSIKLALAGPVSASDSWFGRPVLDLAQTICSTFLNNHNRSLNTIRRREKPLGSPDELADRQAKDRSDGSEDDSIHER
jgi:hypothetical protein